MWRISNKRPFLILPEDGLTLNHSGAVANMAHALLLAGSLMLAAMTTRYCGVGWGWRGNSYKSDQPWGGGSHEHADYDSLGYSDGCEPVA